MIEILRAAACLSDPLTISLLHIAARLFDHEGDTTGRTVYDAI